MGNTRSPFAAALIITLLASAACAPGITPTPTESLTPTPTSRLSTHSGPVIRATLPPTWTLTHTPRPTLTLTPTPVTPTATFTPVPNLAELCDSLIVQYEFQEGHAFASNETISMIYGTLLQVVRDPATRNVVPLTVRFLATHRDSGETLGIDLAGGELFGMELPVSRLPHPGQYGWSIAVTGDGIGEQCVHEGQFFVSRAASALAETPEATAEATMVQ